MRLLLLADIHDRMRYVNKLGELEGGNHYDAVLIAGDITYFKHYKRAIKVLRGIRSYFDSPVLFVPGNCDDPSLLDISLDDEEIYNVHARLLDTADYKVYGIGGCNETPFMTNIEWSEEELAALINRALVVEPGKLILITHAPPHGYLDRVGDIHVGSISYREFLERHGARLWLTGHIHEMRGRVIVGKTLLVNPGPLMRGYYAVARIDNGIEVEFRSLTE